MSISFNIIYPSFSLTQRTKLKNWLQDTVETEGFILKKINYIFCSDEYLLNINRAYLGHDTYTDIITFDLSDNPKQVESEIYISIDRVKENADQFNATFNEELKRVMVHGILHLIGFDDKEENDKKSMVEKENEYLRIYDDLYL